MCQLSVTIMFPFSIVLMLTRGNDSGASVMTRMLMEIAPGRKWSRPVTSELFNRLKHNLAH